MRSLQLITSPVPVARFSGCTTGAPSQADGDCPEPQEVLVMKRSLVSNCYCRSVSKSCLTLHNPIDCRMPGFLVLHYFLEFAQTEVH